MNRWSRMAVIGVLAGATLTGCSARQSSLLMERQSKGPLTDEELAARQASWTLEPASQTKTEGSVEVTATHADGDYLKKLFSEKRIFGGYAGPNPFFSEQMVFYIKFTNTGAKKIRITPNDFVLLDDQGNQFHTLSADYAQALAEAKRPVTTFTRGTLENASPGYFGLSLPIGKVIGKDVRRFAVLKMASLDAGYIYNGVSYDGLIAFWNPHPASQKLRLILANVKTDWLPNDDPAASVDVRFEFSATRRIK